MATKPTVLSPYQRTERQRKRDLDRSRGSASKRGYDAAWRRARAEHLEIEPLCRFCKEVGLIVSATTVDHIIPIRQRPDLRLVQSNLRSLCKTCHDRIGEDQQPAKPKGCDTAGNPVGGWSA